MTTPRHWRFTFSWLSLVLGVGLAAWVFSTTVNAPFYRDDAAHIKFNEGLQKAQSLDELFRDATLGMTRYVTTLVFRGAWELGDGQPWSFRLLSLIFHILNGLLLFSLIRRTFQNSTWLAPAATFCFLLHPMQVNPVVYASKFTILFSSFFILIALNMAARRPAQKEPYFWTLAMSLFGIFSKEIAVVTPLLVGLYRQLKFPHNSWFRSTRTWIYISMFSGLALIFVIANQVPEQPSFGFHVQPAYQYFLTQMNNGWRYLGLALFLIPPSHIHPQPLFDSTVALNGIGFLGLLLVGAYFTWKHSRQREALAFFGLAIALYLAPTHSFIPKRTAFAEYQFYFINGFVFTLLLYALGAVLASFPLRLPQWTWRASTLAMALILAMLAKSEAKLWLNPLELAVKGFEHYPKDSTVSCIMAEKASLCGDKSLAEKLTLDFYKNEHNYYRYNPPRAMQSRFDFLMKREMNTELLRQIRLNRKLYVKEPDASFYQYLLYALRANHLRQEYETELKAARAAFPNIKFLEFLEQMPAKELMRRNPEYWKNVD